MSGTGAFRFAFHWTNSLVQRRQNFAKLAYNVSLLKGAGRIVQHLDLIAGLPEEDYASFRKTFDDVAPSGGVSLTAETQKVPHSG